MPPKPVPPKPVPPKPMPQKPAGQNTSPPEAEKKPLPAIDVNNLHTVPEDKTMGVVRACVKQHNVKRALHGCPPLGYSEVLSGPAKEWAQSLVQRRAFEHSTQSSYGENIYLRVGTQPLADDVAVVNAVDQWYAEIKDYKLFDKEPTMQELMSGSPTGHFTQLIWKSATAMGMGIAKNPQDMNRLIVVCTYYPPGNVVGVFTENVPKLKG